MIPALTTPRLVLRPAQAADLDALWALWTDPEVRRYLWDDRVITRGEADATRADFGALHAQGLGLWVLGSRSADPEPGPLGCAALSPAGAAARYEPRLAGLVEVLVALSPRVWGLGYAHEALGALIAYAAGTLGLDRLAGVTDVPNAASNRMLRRAGFVVLGETEGPRYPLRTYLGTRAHPPAGCIRHQSKDHGGRASVSDKWFEGYGGQTAEQLLALEGEYRTDSLVVAFEEAVQQKAEAGPISKEERYILAVEALEREVNNGGYGQFFLNSSREFVDVIEEALVAIGCPKLAALTRRAIEALNIRDGVTPEKAEAVILQEDESVRDALGACDTAYYDNDEPIADRLFTWIRNNQALVRIGGAARR